MKSVRVLLTLLLVAPLAIFGNSAKASDSTISLSCVTFSWPSTVYRPLPKSSVSFQMKYTNGCSEDLLQVRYEVTNKYGDYITGDSIEGFKIGVTTIEGNYFDEQKFSQVAGPYFIVFTMRYNSTSKFSTPEPVSVPFAFVEREIASPTPVPTVTVTRTPTPSPTVTVTKTPAPAPTVTVTAEPAPAPTVYITNPADSGLADSVISLKSQLSALKLKLKKICATKPKPKGC